MRSVLDAPAYTARSEWGQPVSDHDVFSSQDTVEAVRVMSSVMVLGRHGQVLCSGMMFYSSIIVS